MGRTDPVHSNSDSSTLFLGLIWNRTYKQSKRIFIVICISLVWQSQTKKVTNCHIWRRVKASNQINVKPLVCQCTANLKEPESEMWTHVHQIIAPTTKGGGLGAAKNSVSPPQILARQWARAAELFTIFHWNFPRFSLFFLRVNFKWEGVQGLNY